MRKFLEQFKPDALMQLRLESWIFTRAAEMIEGYNGGTWDDAKPGSVALVLIPGDDSTAYTIETPFGSRAENVDRLTASVAFTFLAGMWFWEMYNDKMTDASQEAFSKWHEAMRDFAYGKATGVNQDTFYKLTDLS